MIELGDEVKDSVSGARGTVIGKHHYLHGCTRITISPKVGKDGTYKGELTFDEPQLVLIKAKVVKEGSHRTGGPSPYKISQKSTGVRNY